jgi:hypothetical protein
VIAMAEISRSSSMADTKKAPISMENYKHGLRLLQQNVSQRRCG